MSTFVRIRYNPCPLCRSKVGPVDQPGFYYTEFETVVECDCHKKWVQQNKLALSAHRANLSEFFLNYNPEVDYDGQLSRDQMLRLVSFVQKYPHVDVLQHTCLYLTGASETQKTYLAKWMAGAFLRQGYSVSYVKMNELLDQLAPDFDNKELHKRAEAKYMSKDILIIDDAFKDRASEYRISLLENFLKGRVEDNDKPIIFVSFVTPNKIKSKGYSESLQNFVIRNTEKKGTLFTMRDIYKHPPIGDIEKILGGSNGTQGK
jgi:DNA replication protein DnaC